MDILEEAEQYFLKVYKRIPINIIRGEGVWLYDNKGNKYLDFVSGIAVNALGYNNPHINNAIKQQLNNNLHLSNFFLQEIQLNLAKKLINITPFDKVFFCNSGAESIEGLLKLAKKWGNRNNKSEIISFSGSFHGRTLGAVSITGQDKYSKNFRPLLPNIKICPFNDAESLRKMINHKTCALFFEGISGEGGIKLLSEEMVQVIRELRSQYEFLIIADEIQTGLGRTGKFYNFEHLDLVPDAITTAKALGGGLPLAAFLVSEKLTDVFDIGEHGTTFGGNPLACAAGLATVNIISEPSFLKNVSILGDYFIKTLLQLKKEYPTTIIDVRGKGLMIGLEIARAGSDIIVAAREKGIFLNITAENSVIRFIPPLVIEKNHIDHLADILSGILKKYN